MVWLEILVYNLATNFQDLVANEKNLVTLVPVLGAILRPDTCLVSQGSTSQISFLFSSS